MVKLDNLETDLDSLTQSIQVDSKEFKQLLEKIANDAEERRKNGDVSQPNYAIDLIKKTRLTAIQLPIEYGGRNANIKDVLYVVSRLAEADSDVAHILRAHYLYVAQFLREESNNTNKEFLNKIAEGTIIGNAFTELSSRNAGHLNFETSLLAEGDHYRLNGTKYFSTGTLYSDLVIVMASTKDGKPTSVIIPTNRDGIIIKDDWDGIGQRHTGSGTTVFNNVLVNKKEVIPINPKSTPFNSFAQLYLHAVIVGILRSIVKDASDLVKNRQRTFSFAAADIPNNDPQLLQIVGEISSIAFAAEAILLRAAETLDVASNSVINGIINYDLSHEASLQASQAKVIIDQLALKAATLIFEVGGASATRQSKHLDRHWRNIRTLASHNPTVYKARVIGDYIVNNNKLPLSEVYY